METQKKCPSKDAILIAYYFVKKNEQDKKGLDNKKLQKLLYYSQAWSVVLNRKPIFPNKIEAWIHGPAIPEVWRVFKEFNFSSPHPEITEEQFHCLDNNDKKILDEVWTIYGRFDGNYLETLSHNELPWQKAREGFSASESSQNEITLDMMNDFYSQKLKKTRDEKHE